jgi:hypothetical protein
MMEQKKQTQNPFDYEAPAVSDRRRPLEAGATNLPDW